MAWQRLLNLFALVVVAVPAAGQESAFRYDPARAPAPGTVWHFVKSNRDGSRPWQLDAYVASSHRIEVVKWAEGSSDFVEVHADFDLARAMPEATTQWNTQGARREPRMWARAPAGERVQRAGLASGQHFELPYAAGPLHFWGFDLMGLNFLLPIWSIRRGRSR